MSKDNFAVVGEKDKMLIFSLVGGDVFSPKGAHDTRTLLSKLLVSYNQIFITSDYARFALDIIGDTYNKPYPIVTILPKDKGDTYVTQRINQEIKKTLGVELLLDSNTQKT